MVPGTTDPRVARRLGGGGGGGMGGISGTAVTFPGPVIKREMTFARDATPRVIGREGRRLGGQERHEFIRNY
jgi:hypothetical protein